MKCRAETVFGKTAPLFCTDGLLIVYCCYNGTNKNKKLKVNNLKDFKLCSSNDGCRNFEGGGRKF